MQRCLVCRREFGRQPPVQIALAGRPLALVHEGSCHAIQRSVVQIAGLLALHGGMTALRRKAPWAAEVVEDVAAVRRKRALSART